ncbi:MAG: hypothetical protein ACE5GQ_01310 [Nitrospinales bacterium]
MSLFEYDELISDAIICPANFGNGAEGSAASVIDYAVKSGLFRQGFLCNTYQDEKKGRLPLTKCVEKSFEAKEPTTSYSAEKMREIIEKASVTYPDERYCNFKSMLKLTRKGTFTVPRSRSLGNGLKVELGVYERIVEL